MRQHGWYAGVLTEGLDTTSVRWLANVTTPLLVVVDYADARISEVHDLLQILRARPRHPAVVVLSARALAEDWLEEILNRETSNNHPLTIEAVPLEDGHPLSFQVYVPWGTGSA